MKKNSPLFERLEALYKHNGYRSVNEFATKGLGYNSSEKLNRLKDENNKPSVDILLDIANKFENVTIDWLLTGKALPYVNELSGALAEPVGVYESKGAKTGILQNIPLYDIRGTASIAEFFTNGSQSKPDPLDYVRIPNMPKCDGALFINEDSMYPVLKSGDIVLYKVVQDKQNIIWGEMYLVAVQSNGDSFFFAKYIQKSEQDGWVKLVSQSPNHQSKDFPLESIKAIAIIKASIRYNSGV